MGDKMGKKKKTRIGNRQRFDENRGEIELK